MIRIFLLTLAVVMVSCSSAPKVEELPDTADASEELGKLDNEFTQVADKQPDVLAPTDWREADSWRETAKDRLAKNDKARRVLDAIAESRAYLNRSVARADSAATVVPDIMRARVEASDVSASTFAAREWERAEKALTRFASGREGEAFTIPDKKRSELRDYYIDARVEALKNSKLGEAKRLIKDATDSNAMKLTPNVLQQAERSYRNAEAYIEANRLDMPGIQRATEKATMDARHLVKLTQAARQAERTPPEQRALLMERASQNRRALAGAMDRQAFDQKYEEAQQMFSPGEAEVYKQRDSLLIRMHGIDFVVGRSELPPSSYATVTKVGQVLKLFGEPQVRIEGHTDSTGPHKINEKLSQDRAEAVKEYLTANLGLQPDRIETVGLADRRPLATNKTEAGRAQNRRVDIIITPVIQPEEIRQAL